VNTVLFITSFLPVAVFKTIARLGDATLTQAKIATVVGLVLAVIQFVLSRKVTKHTTYLEWAFLGFLAAGAAWIYLAPTNIANLFVNNSTTILYFILFLTTLLPQLFGFDPFTYAIAKNWQPEAVWKTPQFRIINLHITYVFSGLFFLATLSCFVGQGKPLYSIAIPLMLIICIGIPFSRKYPANYISKQGTIAPVNLTSLPKTTKELIAGMPTAFNAVAVGDLTADVQFRISGEETFNMFLSIADGKCSVHDGEAKLPVLTILAPADIWMKMARGEINRQKAFMDGLFKIEGDMDLLMKMGELFSSIAKVNTPTEGEHKVIKILAIQGSPRPKVSNTEVLLQEFLKGTINQGAQTETIYLKEKKINFCVGCYTCWTKTPGVCVHKDDMPEILQKIRECDIIVYATPLYNYNVTGLFKVFQDRTIPLLDPHIIKVGNAHRHPYRYETNRKMVLISNCGFPDVKHFDGLRKVFHVIEENGSIPLAGELLVPAGEMLKQEFLKGKWARTFAALNRAGVELVRDGRVSKEAEEIVQKPIISPDEMIAMANIAWDNKIAGVSIDEPQKAGNLDDMRLVLRGMATIFNPEAKPGLQAVIQFEVTGKQTGNWFLSIADGKCTFHDGLSLNPNVAIKTSSEVWLAIVNKELDGQRAFMEGKYKVEGDMSLLMSMKDLFAGN
jgi:multimeric flavodoxin WrbA/putative sterol carrier protein